MKWSFVLLLPACTSALWALIVLLFKRHPTRAQVVLSLSLLLLAFAITVLDVFFRGRAGQLFIYDFVFDTMVMLCAPFYYVGICALTEPRGTTLRQRHSFIPSLLFIVGLIVAAFWLGPRRYDIYCHAVREGTATWQPGDTPWNFMLFWNHWLFPILLLLVGFVLMFMGTRKMKVFQRRFNSYYARDINVPFIDIRQMVLVTWLFLPLGLLVLVMITFRPMYYKYWLIGCSLILAVLQWFMGRLVYKFDYDARYLAEYIVKKSNTTQQSINTPSTLRSKNLQDLQDFASEASRREEK